MASGTQSVNTWPNIDFVLAPLDVLAAGYHYEVFYAQTTLQIAVVVIVIPTILVLFVKDIREIGNQDENRQVLACQPKESG